MSWHSWQNLPILLYREFIKFQQCIVLETIHNNLSPPWRAKEILRRGGVGWLLKVFFLGAPRLVSYQKLPTEPLLSKLKCISYFTFKRRLTVVIDSLFLVGIPNQVGKNITEILGGWKFKGMGGLKHKRPACMWGVWIFFGTTQFQDKPVDVFLLFKF